MEELMNILEDLRPDVDFENETALITEGILDSFDVVSLVTSLSDTYGIEISSNYLVPANFDSAEAIYALIQKLED